MLVNPYNTINGCPDCKIIYVRDDGTGDPSQTVKKDYSDDLLIGWLITRTREKKLDWVAHQNYMDDNYPFILDLGNVRFILVYNGRYIELRLYWIFKPDEDYEDKWPELKTNPSTPGNNITDLEDVWDYPYGWGYVVKGDSPAPEPIQPVVYVRFTDEEIQFVLDTWDYRKPFRILTTEYYDTIYELKDAVREYCNKYVRKTTWNKEKLEQSRKEIIDTLEAMG